MDLAIALEKFRQGAVVQVYKRDVLTGELTVVAAQTEQDILDHILDRADHDTPEEVERFAQKISAHDYKSVRLYEMIGAEMWSTDACDFSCLVWQNNEGAWDFADSSEPGAEFVDFPTGIKSAIFLGIGQIVRSTWGIDIEERRQAGRVAYLAGLFDSNPERAQHLIRGGFADKTVIKRARILRAGKT